MSQLPKNKNLPDVEQIAKVEAYGVFTGQSGKYWMHPGRGQKALTPEELEKFDEIILFLEKKNFLLKILNRKGFRFSKISDINKVESWAREAMKWAMQIRMAN